MQLPNKLYSFQESTLYLMPKVMRELNEDPVSVRELYKRMSVHLAEPTDFLSVMDALYALGAVDINDDEEVFSCLSK